MNINLSKLRAMGFQAEISKDRNTVAIFPTSVDPDITERVRDLCGVLGFNDSETDQFHGSLHHIQVMSAIRKCSNW